MINCAFHIALKIYTAPDSARHKNLIASGLVHRFARTILVILIPEILTRPLEMAWHDASLSHIKNGIYEAMFIATMLARAAVSTDIADVIQSGLSEIPIHLHYIKAFQKCFDFRRDFFINTMYIATPSRYILEHTTTAVQKLSNSFATSSRLIGRIFAEVVSGATCRGRWL